jgi:hypothetical protein
VTNAEGWDKTLGDTHHHRHERVVVIEAFFVAFTTGAVVFLCYKTAQTGLTP